MRSASHSLEPPPAVDQTHQSLPLSDTKRKIDMPDLTATAARLDPYKNFRFLLKWDGRTIAGISGMSALTRSTEVLVTREGGDPNRSHKLPGQTKFDAITLERGITHDTDFDDWARKTWRSDSPHGQPSSADVRKDVTIELYNEAGELALAYRIFRCWVSEYSVVPHLDNNTPGTTIERITLQNEGWERDPNF